MHICVCVILTFNRVLWDLSHDALQKHITCCELPSQQRCACSSWYTWSCWVSVAVRACTWASRCPCTQASVPSARDLSWVRGWVWHPEVVTELCTVSFWVIIQDVKLALQESSVVYRVSTTDYSFSFLLFKLLHKQAHLEQMDDWKEGSEKNAGQRQVCWSVSEMGTCGKSVYKKSNTLLFAH